MKAIDCTVGSLHKDLKDTIVKVLANSLRQGDEVVIVECEDGRIAPYNVNDLRSIRRKTFTEGYEEYQAKVEVYNYTLNRPLISIYAGGDTVNLSPETLKAILDWYNAGEDA